MSRPTVTIAAGGSLEASFLPYRLTHLRARFDLDLRLALTPEALKFVRSMPLRALSKHPVYVRNGQFCERTGVPLHKALAKSDAIIIYPATPRLISEMATGSITCAVTRLFAFAPKQRVIIAPQIHPDLDKSIYIRSLADLANRNCIVLASIDLWCAWQIVENALSNLLGVIPREYPADERIGLDEDEDTCS